MASSWFYRFWLNPWIFGTLCGLLYGVISRYLLYNPDLNSLWGLTTFGFVFLVPFVMGYLSIIFRQTPFKGFWDKVLISIFLPWLPTLLCLSMAFVTGVEVMVCLIMAMPVFLFMSSLGGIVALIVREKGNEGFRRHVLAGILVLPVSTSTLENYVPLDSQVQEVKNTIEIAAPAEQVWGQIKRVPMIQPQEQAPSFFHALGFPRPLEATLSFEGVGGVREASFEENVLFLETITEWQPQRSIAFTIEAQSEKSQSAFLNSKILGGDYFDVLEGRYEIETLPAGGVRLYLSSKHRVATHYNFYAGYWTRWVMSDLQKYILEIIKRRSESSLKP